MVKRVNQSQAGGAVNYNEAYDAVQGSTPLERVEKQDAPGLKKAADLVNNLASGRRPNIIGDLSNGAHFIGDVPEDASPDQAVQYAQGDPVQERPLGETGAQTQSRYEEHYRNQPHVQTAAQSYAKALLGDPIPRVDVTAGRVMLSELHMRPDGTVHLDPEDAEDFIDLLRVNVKRAKRQQL